MKSVVDEKLIPMFYTEKLEVTELTVRRPHSHPDYDWMTMFIITQAPPNTSNNIINNTTTNVFFNALSYLYHYIYLLLPFI